MYIFVISWLHSNFIIWCSLLELGGIRKTRPNNNKIEAIEVFNKLHDVKKLFITIA